MDINLPIEFTTDLYAKSEAGFSVCHFKNIRHASNAPAHFHVVISLKNGLSVVICIITTQMHKLEWRYSTHEPTALNSLIPLDPSSMKCIFKPCVINCNSAEIVTTAELAQQVDPSIGIRTCETDERIDFELKKRILSAIQASPIVKKNIKEELLKAYRSLFPME